MNRAQPTNLASGVHCTAWLEGRGHGRTHAIRRARPAVVRTRGHGTPWHAPPSSGTRRTWDSLARPAVDQNARRTGLACPQRAGHDGPSSARA